MKKECFFNEAGFKIAISPVSDVSGAVICVRKYLGSCKPTLPPIFCPLVLGYLFYYVREIKVLFAESETWQGFFYIVVLMRSVHWNNGDYSDPNRLWLVKMGL